MRHWMICFLAVLTVIGPTSAQDQTVVTLAAATLFVDQPATLEARIDCAAAACTAFDVTLAYDPAMLQVDSAATGPFLGDRVLEADNTIDPVSGTVRLAATVLADPPENPDPILFRLTVVGLAAGTTRVRMAELQVADLVGEPVASTGIDAELTIETQAVNVTPTPTPPPGWPGGEPITSNADWKPVIQAFDGVEMVLVPVGSFMLGGTPEQVQAAYSQCVTTLGTANCAREFFVFAAPQTRITFDTPFWMDRYEVTNQQFADFDGQASVPSRFSSANRPREKITWFEARDFCAQRGARLPTEAEWEYAARGPDDLVYPWGNAWNTAVAVWGGNSDGRTAMVGSHPQGASWVGAQDLGGNVQEWTHSLHDPYPYRSRDGREGDTGGRTDVARVLRGGAWVNDPADRFRSWIRLGESPAMKSDDSGFRCVRDYSS